MSVDPYVPPANPANDTTGYPAPTQDQRELAAVASAQTAGLVQCLTADDFFAAESTANLVVPKLGICPGPPTGIVGQAYVGKTIVALSFGLSVALGKPLWGTFATTQGPWLHLDHEQGRRHTKARVHRLARGFGVSDDELRALIETGTIRISVLPDLRLTTDRAVDHYRRAFDGVSLVTCDSLRPMLGGVDENSSQVRGLVGVLSAASDATAASVALIAHAGKTPGEGSNRTRKEMARGSSAIVDEFQSMLVMSKAKNDAFTLVTHEKDRELGVTVDNFGLRIDDVAASDVGDDPKWGLRVVHVDREQMKGKPEDLAAKAAAKAVDGVRDCIRRNPGIAGNERVAQQTGTRLASVVAAVKQLIADEEIVEVKGKGNSRRLFMKGAVPCTLI